MIIDDLIYIAQLGAKKPLFLWSGEGKKLFLSLIPKLEKIGESLEDGTQAKKHIDHFVKVLGAEEVDEFLIAQHMLYLTEVLQRQTGKEQKELVNTYIQYVTRFYSRSQTASLHRRQRVQLKEKLSDEEQVEYDLKLFKNEGMIYCLEYYLALYKTMQDAEDVNLKKKYIEADNIDLGFGDLPGLKSSFKDDEILTKFVYKILNDEIREAFMPSYLILKDELEKIHINCDKQGNCNVAYEDTSVEAVIDLFKKFLHTMIELYQQVGIDQLASVFFSPYGKNARLDSIVL